MQSVALVRLGRQTKCTAAGVEDLQEWVTAQLCSRRLQGCLGLWGMVARLKEVAASPLNAQ